MFAVFQPTELGGDGLEKTSDLVLVEAPPSGGK